jgi:hypothetical protein
VLPSMVSPTTEMVIWLPAGLAGLATPRFDDDALVVAGWVPLGPVNVAPCAVAWSGADFPKPWTNSTVPAAMVRPATTAANHRHRWRPPALA